MSAEAAKRGDWEMLKWLKENGCDWDPRACAEAAKRGDLEMLKWLKENGCGWDSRTHFQAEKYHHVELLKWVEEHGCEKWSYPELPHYVDYAVHMSHCELHEKWLNLGVNERRIYFDR